MYAVLAVSDIVERLREELREKRFGSHRAEAEWLRGVAVRQLLAELEQKEMALDLMEGQKELVRAELDKANTDNWKTVVEKTLEAANLNTALLAGKDEYGLDVTRSPAEAEADDLAIENERLRAENERLQEIIRKNEPVIRAYYQEHKGEVVEGSGHLPFRRTVPRWTAE